MGVPWGCCSCGRGTELEVPSIVDALLHETGNAKNALPSSEAINTIVAFSQEFFVNPKDRKRIENKFEIRPEFVTFLADIIHLHASVDAQPYPLFLLYIISILFCFRFSF